MAIILFDPPNFLVLDETANHLEMAAKEMLLAALAAGTATRNRRLWRPCRPEECRRLK